MAWYDPTSWFGGKSADPYGAASPYLAQSEEMYKQYYSPYTDLGTRTMSTLEDQYSRLLSDPASQWALLGQGFQASPGYDWQMQQAMNAANMSAAAGGMAGTPAHQQQSMQMATDLANQDYYNYMNNMMGLYGQGLSGTQGLFNTGYGATQSLADALGGVYGSKANLGYASEASKQQQAGSLVGGLLGGATSFF